MPYICEGYPFVPIGGGPDAGYRSDFERVLESRTFRRSHSPLERLPEYVNDFKTRVFSEVIDAGNIEQVGESEFRCAGRKRAMSRTRAASTTRVDSPRNFGFFGER